MRYKQELSRMATALEVLRDMDPYITIQMSHIYLLVSAQPGITMAELAKLTGMTQASVSRNVAALGEWHRKQKPGANVVEAVDDPHERRRKICFLTSKGQKTLRQIVSILKGVPLDEVEIDVVTADEALKATYKAFRKS